MGAPDSLPDFLPTHLVLWVAPWPVSLAPMGFIYDNGNDFMSQHLAPPVSLPDTAPSQIVPLGGIPFNPRLSRSSVNPKNVLAKINSGREVLTRSGYIINCI